MRVPQVLPMLLLLAASQVLADTIDLRDGASISGTVSQQGDKLLIKGDDGSVWLVAQSDILRVKLNPAAAKSDGAKAEWELAVVQISRSSDLETIIDLHKKFLDKYPDQPISARVKQSLDDYQKLADQHAVKFHGNWISKSDADAQQRQWNEQATAALADYEANHLTQAKRAFIALLRDDPTSVVALNNLAVIAARQNSTNEAMNYYAQAVRAAPDNRLLLDNVAEEIRLQGDPENSAAFRLHRLWLSSEKQVEPAMARQDLYRWGAGWISKQDQSAMQSMVRDVQSQINQVAPRYNADQSEVDRLNDAIDANQQAYADAGDDPDVDQSAADRDRLTQEYNDLNDQLNDAQSALSDDESDAEPLLQQLSTLQDVGFTGVQRVMYPGDDSHPPVPPRVRVPSAQ